MRYQSRITIPNRTSKDDSVMESKPLKRNGGYCVLGKQACEYPNHSMSLNCCSCDEKVHVLCGRDIGDGVFICKFCDPLSPIYSNVVGSPRTRTRRKTPTIVVASEIIPPVETTLDISSMNNTTSDGSSTTAKVRMCTYKVCTKVALPGTRLCPTHTTTGRKDFKSKRTASKDLATNNSTSKRAKNQNSSTPIEATTTSSSSSISPGTPPGKTTTWRKFTSQFCSQPGCTNLRKKKVSVCIEHHVRPIKRYKSPRKQCTYSGCIRLAQNNTVCRTHGAVYRKCIYCNRRVMNSGLCGKHGAVVTPRTENSNNNRLIVIRRCTRKGCTRRIVNSGVCGKHGAIVKPRKCNTSIPAKVKQTTTVMKTKKQETFHNKDSSIANSSAEEEEEEDELTSSDTEDEYNENTSDDEEEELTSTKDDNSSIAKPGRQMKLRPFDFDEDGIRKTPTFCKWLLLQDGMTMTYASRTFVKGHLNEEERLMRRIMTFKRNHTNYRRQLLLQKNAAVTNDTTSFVPKVVAVAAAITANESSSSTSTIRLPPRRQTTNQRRGKTPRNEFASATPISKTTTSTRKKQCIRS